MSTQMFDRPPASNPVVEERRAILEDCFANPGKWAIVGSFKHPKNVRERRKSILGAGYRPGEQQDWLHKYRKNLETGLYDLFVSYDPIRAASERAKKLPQEF